MGAWLGQEGPCTVPCLAALSSSLRDSNRHSTGKTYLTSWDTDIEVTRGRDDTVGLCRWSLTVLCKTCHLLLSFPWKRLPKCGMKRIKQGRKPLVSQVYLGEVPFVCFNMHFTLSVDTFFLCYCSNYCSAKYTIDSQ